jgi:hypothetical protein
MTLLDVHHEFEKINGITTMVIEVFAQNDLQKAVNIIKNPITSILLLIDSETAKLDVGPQYAQVRVLITVTDKHDSTTLKSSILPGSPN